MSSGFLDTQTHRSLFCWSDSLNADEYVIVKYEVVSSRAGEETAIAMAMEQSVGTAHIPGYVFGVQFQSHAAKVRRVEHIPNYFDDNVYSFNLDTDIYKHGGRAPTEAYRIEIAYPDQLLKNNAVQWLNVLVGEIPRLGFVTALRIVDIQFPTGSLPGPLLGVSGLRRALRVDRSPLLCRSTRPAIGLDLATMARINEDVLTHGFHAVKDDELQAWPDAKSFKSHVEAMVDARNRAEDNSGEKKFYIANLLCEPADLAERADIVESLSADAVLVAPAVQGLGVLRWVRSLTQLPILAHNTFSEMFTRHPSWRIDPAVYVRMQRALGADWIVTPGAFGNPDVDEDELVDAARAVNEPLGKCAPCMPIVQGGKRPAGLSDYIGAVGGLDFMLIVASWVDGHPDGLTSACMKFREAVDAL